jgi:hypothetical protein
MRRVLAVFAVGLGLFFATACNGDNGNGDDGSGDGGPPATSAVPSPTDAGGTATTEEVCAAAEEVFADIDGEGDTVREALVEAAESGDEAELEQARSDYLEFANGVADDARALAATAADPELQSAIETFADQFEVAAALVAENPEQLGDLDLAEFEAALDDVAAFCE